MKRYTVYTYVPDEDTHFTQPIGSYQQVAFAWIASDIARRLYKDKPVAVDVGAHIGHMCFVFAQRFEQVHAFEPIEENIECLKKNLDQFTRKGKTFLERITIHQHPLSNKQRDVAMTNPTEINSGAWELCEGKGHQTKTLDDYHLDDVGLIKLDTQGCEIAVLQGASKTITKNQPILMVEVVNNEVHDLQLEDYIVSLGYVPLLRHTKQTIFVPTSLTDQLREDRRYNERVPQS